MTTINKEVTNQVIAMAEKGRSLEDITVLLYMNEEYDTKAKCRAVVTEVLKDADLTPKKKVPMSVQLKEWFLNLDEPLEMTKDDLVKQINDLGMSGGSVKWYTDMYMSAVELATKITTK